MGTQNEVVDGKHTTPTKPTKPKRFPVNRLLLVILVVILAGACGYGVYYWQHRKVEHLTKQLAAVTVKIDTLTRQISALSVKENSAEKNAAASKSTSQLAQTSINETVSTPLDLQYEPDGGSIQNYPATFSMVVPLSLRTQITNSECVNGDQDGPAGPGSILEECLHLSFADMLGSGDSLVNSSYMSVWDGYSWLTRDEDDSGQAIPLPPFGLTTVAQKQSAWNLLLSLTPTTDIKAIFNQLPVIEVDAASVSGNQHITFVQSADSHLKGYAYVATLAQDEEYNPCVYYVMGGMIGTQPVLISGEFQASDPTVLQINSLLKQNTQSSESEAGNLIAQASNQLSAGKLSAQTTQSFSQVINILKSIRLSAS